MVSKNQGRKNPPSKTNKEPIAIVGIGASAGGLEAFTRMVKVLPGDTGMAFVFILHLVPTHESRLSEILSNYTGMPVKQVSRTTRVSPDQIYVIPPNKYLGIKNNSLFLTKREKTDGIFLPVDYFFNSLAKELRNKAIGIVLSGTAADGTAGMKTIKSEGGLTFAQDLESAKYSGMPASAIEAGNVDIILPPEKIAAELVRIGSHPYIAFSKPKLKQESLDREEDDAYSRIFRKLRMATGVDFTNYKLNTIRRRITRRMVLNKVETLEDYSRLIIESGREVNELYRDLLINVTNFFRDPLVFEMLNEKVFPDIIKNISPGSPVRIWVPGCSTGEEVYSIAITLFEYFDKISEPVNVQIFATDISDTAIEKARRGLYPESGVKDISPEIRKKYFTRINGSYQIIKNIRDVCIFAKQDISKDPPFSRIDLLSCRNLLIYFSVELQKKIIPVFHYALKPGGYLLLGTSESVGAFGDLFKLSERKFKLYSKKTADVRLDLNFSYATPAEKPDAADYSKDYSGRIDLQKEADRIVMNKYTPPGILVNSSMEIIQFRGKVNRYLNPSSGDASLNVFKMLEENLNLDLHTALRKVRQTGNPVIINDVRMDKNGSSEDMDLEVIPVKGNTGTKDLSYLILFKDKTVQKDESPDKKVKYKSTGNASDVERLRRELRATKENLQSIIEERQAANEELRSALEELQSSNEEMQSTNEEMETAREELQSTNEELITVNDELESRNEQLNHINDDLDNLLSSVNIPIIMLDMDLKIRRYTPRAERIWNLINGDLGRPIDNINPNLKVPDLVSDVRDVLNNFESKEKKIKDNEGIWYSMKIRPYRTMDNKVDGVVISLLEMDALKKEFEIGVNGWNFARQVFKDMDGALVVLDEGFKIIDATGSFYEMFDIDPGLTEGKVIFDISADIWSEKEFGKFLKDMDPAEKNVKSQTRKFILGNKNHKLTCNAQWLKIPGNAKQYLFVNFTKGK